MDSLLVCGSWRGGAKMEQSRGGTDWVLLWWMRLMCNADSSGGGG